MHRGDVTISSIWGAPAVPATPPHPLHPPNHPPVSLASPSISCCLSEFPSSLCPSLISKPFGTLLWWWKAGGSLGYRNTPPPISFLLCFAFIWHGGRKCLHVCTNTMCVSVCVLCVCVCKCFLHFDCMCMHFFSRTLCVSVCRNACLFEVKMNECSVEPYNLFDRQ